MRNHHTKTSTQALILLALLMPIQLFATEPDSVAHKKKHTFGLLPAFAYDSDLGIKWGALTNIYWHGDPSIYPDYQHSLFAEASKYTSGSTLLRVYYDSKQLFKPIRTNIDITSIRDQRMDFFGFNGYQSVYNPNFITDDGNADYKTRAFYNHHREKFRVMVNLVGPISKNIEHWAWVGGVTLFSMKIKPVDINHINEKSNDPLPNEPGLYDKYVAWQIIDANEKNGGTSAYLKYGLSYDSRDIESNPSKGLYTELLFSSTPSFLSSHKSSYTRLTAIHRQYITLIKDKSIFAYRLMYQSKLAGDVPFYLAPHMVSSTLGGSTSQGLGGAKTLRGIKRNRVVGDGVLLGNIELRQILKRGTIKKQDFYVATNLFYDFGMVVQPYDMDLTKVDANEKPLYFSSQKEKPHNSLGMGLKLCMNENFIVSIDYGLALNKQDGNSGLYIVLNYLF